MNIKELREKYPNAFEDQMYSYTYPAGWKTIVEDCLTLMLGGYQWYDKALDDYDAVPGNYIKILQIKEKFGSLRIYFDIHTEPHNYIGDSMYKQVLFKADGIVNYAEMLASKTCQVCGDHGELRTANVLGTYCDDHYNSIVNNANERFRD